MAKRSGEILNLEKALWPSRTVIKQIPQESY